LKENQIRLLVLEPGNEDSELRCEIICGALNDYYLPYEALSYAWGDQSDVAEALCNGLSMRITKSLHDALMAIRLKSATRTIWVDALCINQLDILERNHQVQLMSHIYSGATRVIVWLGDEDPDTGSALEMISHCANAFELSNDPSKRLDVDSNHNHLPHGISSLSDPRWKALGNFLLRPWFKRAWVVQEVALANEVIFHCGTITISWEQVLKAMMGIFSMDLGDLVTNENESIICLHFYQRAYALSRSYLGNKSDILRLEVLLLAEGARLASDDRDKVFAFLGLANDVQSSNIPSGMSIHADYGKGVSEVYVEITRKVIEHYQSLTILAAAGLPVEPGSHKVPSWVCDRSLKPRANVFMSPAAKQQFSACDAPANCRFTPDQKGLITSGVIHDTISVIRKPYSHRDLEESIIIEWGVIAGLHKLPVAPHDIDSFRLTLVGNFGQDGPLTDFELESFFPWYESISKKKSRILPWGKRPSLSTDLEEGRMIRRFRALVHRASGWRSFFLTNGGLIGIGPATAAAGDLVCVVEGATVPLILRRGKGDEGGKFQFVGESYVHELMGGEGYKTELLRELILC
jgi:hypothetical protein